MLWYHFFVSSALGGHGMQGVWADVVVAEVGWLLSLVTFARGNISQENTCAIYFIRSIHDDFDIS